MNQVVKVLELQLQHKIIVFMHVAAGGTVEVSQVKKKNKQEVIGKESDNELFGHSICP